MKKKESQFFTDCNGGRALHSAMECMIFCTNSLLPDWNLFMRHSRQSGLCHRDDHVFALSEIECQEVVIMSEHKVCQSKDGNWQLSRRCGITLS